MLPPHAPPGGLRELAEIAAREFADAGAAEILRWAGEVFGPGLVLASSMADTHLVHLAQSEVPGIDVLFLDTGYHFAETIGTRDAVAAVYDVNLISIAPKQTVDEQDAEFGPRLHDREPERCCALRKVEPLERGLAPYTAWINGMRAGQNAFSASASMTIESLPPENSSTGRSNSATASRKMWTASASRTPRWLISCARVRVLMCVVRTRSWRIRPSVRRAGPRRRRCAGCTARSRSRCIRPGTAG